MPWPRHLGSEVPQTPIKISHPEIFKGFPEMLLVIF
jgi:hypothetical protein